MTLQDFVISLKDKTIAVIGIGVSNTPLIELLCSNGCDVTACDKRSREEMGPEAERLEALGAKLKFGGDYLEGLNQNVVFRTPGLMPFDPHLQAARERGSVVTSEIEAFFSLCPCPILAVTGSDGKTTTTTIISELLKAQGYRVHLGGNIGHPLLCDVPNIRQEDFAVLELSSFQLHSMNCRPHVAVITNISPNHLDKHLDYQDYIDAKRSIFLQQSPEDRLVLNLDDGQTPYYASSAHAEISYFSDKNTASRGTFCIDSVLYRVDGTVREKIMRKDEILLPGEHNVLNYLAAFEATRGLVDAAICRDVAMRFKGVEHRLEQVRELRGVTYINDSIGSSPSRTIAGLRALKRKPILIAGGYDKHIPFDALGDELCRSAKQVFLTGDTAEKIRAAILASPLYSDSGLEVRLIADFDEAVYAAAASAREGDIVLLSPACASFDHFKNFAERGNHFKELIMELS
ncbi:MAG: UDP-N-acetylmuramoyl-L-alanine--D-glutamate ligase [Oscillospiraceae bacterium]|nr:UDP-N-acetylmuramoyl-L-alanine--D-glutamate ligase [Oscillospiraceae bacterium]